MFAVQGDELEVLKLAASAEAPSEHPLARAVVDRAEANGIALVPAEDFEAVAGRGLRARVDDEPVLVGSLRFLWEEGIDLTAVEAWEEEAKTVVGVAAGSRLHYCHRFSHVLGSAIMRFRTS